MNKVKKLFGIDTLYFFFETNENYDDLYLEILDQLEDIKGKFQKKEIDYENKDLYVSIKDTRLNFLGKKEGFYWFKDLNGQTIAYSKQKAFKLKEDIILYWDEPTITLDYDNHPFHEILKNN